MKSDTQGLPGQCRGKLLGKELGFVFELLVLHFTIRCSLIVLLGVVKRCDFRDVLFFTLCDCRPFAAACGVVGRVVFVSRLTRSHALESGRTEVDTKKRTQIDTWPGSPRICSRGIRN